jgi:hypothetical protein
LIFLVIFVDESGDGDDLKTCSITSSNEIGRADIGASKKQLDIKNIKRENETLF